MKYSDKKTAFTFAEAMLVVSILGILIVLSVSAIKLYNPAEKGYETMSVKMAENIEAATLHILLNNSVYDDFLRIKDKEGYFSIEDKDITKRMSDLYSNYLSDITYGIDLSTEYFSNEILDYDRTSVGEKLKDTYSDFFFFLDGTLVGFRFYNSCKAAEKNANPPHSKGRYSVDEVCGSVFFDVNSFKEPNKLGSDQYILPIYKRGIKYDNE